MSRNRIEGIPNSIICLEVFFVEYLFATMSERNTEKIKCTARNSSNKNNEMTGLIKWIKENMLLLETLLGVIVGTILGSSFDT